MVKSEVRVLDRKLITPDKHVSQTSSFQKEVITTEIIVHYNNDSIWKAMQQFDSQKRIKKG